MSNIDPPASWADVDGINTNERLLGGPSGPLNRAVTGLTARTKQLQADDVAAAAALAGGEGARKIGFTQRTVPSTIIRTLDAKGQENVSIFDVMSDAQVAAFLNHDTQSYDFTTLFNNVLANRNVRLNINRPGTLAIGGRILFSQSNTSVFCDPGAVLFQMDASLNWMVSSTLDGLEDITWNGGQFNGNDLGHTPEVPGDPNWAPAAAFVMRSVRRLKLGNVFIHDVRGHAINHWNCEDFHIHDVRIRANPIRVQTIDGGVRRDGVTGSSNYGLIENISGFVDDDLVAILAGADWGLAGQIPQDCYGVQIRNLRATPYAGKKPWRLLRVMPAGGYKMDGIEISGLYGECAGDPIVLQLDDLVGKTRGQIGTLRISDVDVTDPGQAGYPNSVTRNHVTIQGINADKIELNNHTWRFKDQANRVNLRCLYEDNSEIKSLSLNNITVIDGRTTDDEMTVARLAPGGSVSITNLTVLGRDTKTSASYAVARVSSLAASDNSQRLDVYGANWQMPYIGANVLRAANTFVPFTRAVICPVSLPTPTNVTGVIFTDPLCGVVRYQNGDLIQVEPPTVEWKADGSHLPTTGWRSGFRLMLRGSPFNAMDAQVARSGTSPYSFQTVARDGLNTGFTTATVLSLIPTDFAPDCATRFYITDGAAAGTPGSAAGLLVTNRFGGSSAALTNCFQQFYAQGSTNAVYIRQYVPTGTPGWTAWRTMA